ncbi:MAG: RCC1 domain-containing protein [Pseudomonadales bacterium]
MPALSNPVSLSVEDYTSCALDDERALLGNWQDWFSAGTCLVNPVAITSGRDFTCALDATGVHCWGWNTDGQMAVPALDTPTAVRAGLFHACALDAYQVCIVGAEHFRSDRCSSTQQSDGDCSGFCPFLLDDGGVHCWRQTL